MAGPRPLSAAAIVFFPLLLIALWGLLAWPWLSGQVTIPYDSKTYHLPTTAIALEAIFDGTPPFWNPFLSGGAPLLSDPQSLIYSPLYMALMGAGDYYSSNWLDVVQLLHVLFGGLGIFLYCRAQRLPSPAGVAAALVVMFGGVMASRMQHTSIIVAYSYAPWVLLSLHLLLRQRRPRWTVATAVCVALLALHFVQVAFLFCLLIAIYTVAAIAMTGEAQARWDKLKYGVLAGAIALLLVALPTLLVLRHLALSTRTRIPFEVAAFNNVIHPTTLLTLIAPDALGTLSAGRYDGIGDITEQYLYCGVLAAALMLCALLFGIRQRQRQVLFWAAIAVLSLLYALGKWTPVFKLFYDFVPGVALFRRPTDASFLLIFSAAMLVAHFLGSIDAYCQSVRSQRFYRTAIALPMLAVASIALFAVTDLQWSQHFDAVTLVYFLLFLMLAAGIPILARHHPLFVSGSAFSLMVVLAMAADLFAHNVNRPMNATDWPGFALLERGANGELPVVEWLRSASAAREIPAMPARIEVVGLPQNWPNTLGALGFESTHAYSPLQLDRYRRVVGMQESGTQRTWTPLLPGYDAPMFNLLGVRYIIATRGSPGLNSPKFPLRHRSETDGLSIEVRENPRALPRIFSVTEAILDPEADETIAAGLQYEVDFSKQAVVERDEVGGTALRARVPTRLCEESVASDRLVAYAPNRLVVQSESPCPRILLVNDIWHPDWRVFVNGQERELLRTNFLFQGVFLEPGRRSVELVFNPFHFLAP